VSGLQPQVAYLISNQKSLRVYPWIKKSIEMDDRPRERNTNVHGMDWPEFKMLKVWAKAASFLSFPPSVWRQDICGNLMRWDQFGYPRSAYGWEIDHILPISAGGKDNMENLQALSSSNNDAKGG
jgi:hypothetical protein